MIRYRLDDLGWFQFEWLIQSLLKAELGLGIESWGGRGDYGRDAYTREKIRYFKGATEAGPHLFQVKFVEEANAAGANSEERLLSSITQEITQIKKRRSRKKWTDPKWYSLFTNAPINAKLREKISRLFVDVLPKTKILTKNGNDICDLLDNQEKLRRAFPQLLSLRDLNALIGKAVDKEALERSQSAVDLAKDIAPVFVPTTSYEQAWKKLNEHHFVVLDGPPEMGKTAIAWMIALTQLSTGWQALICDKPEDFFQLYDIETSQVFVADDAFGRTEYDPARGVLWEQYFDRVIRRLDKNHWLLWTSRKHILERALKTMDLQGSQSRKYPKITEVLVDASKLDSREKALILYRHARAAGFEMETRNLIKHYARQIVEDSNFTPERIRRFIKEVVPDLIDRRAKGELISEALSVEITKAIQTPTERMQRTFEALSDSHKLLLVTLLGTRERIANEDFLKAAYESYNQDIPKLLPFTQSLEELSESFIKIT
jgi:hypothetical protein